MPPKPISQHVAEVMGQIEAVRKLSADERVELTVALHHLLRKIQGGAAILDPLYLTLISSLPP